LVVFGRPKGDRGSCKQWEEAGIAPHVVFEVLLPNNRFPAMYRKLRFYEEHGVEEYYLYDPNHNELEGWLRDDDGRSEIRDLNGWTSPRLGVRFDISANELTLYGPDGRRFLTPQELAAERERVEQERDSVKLRSERIAAQLRALGVEPAD
jgi:hypothetical protein